ncbi:hypothetical protein EYS10_01615 (plasmid) [Rahnella aquatilis]|uniref:hypothetical protein n=1 Tax=Rahnella TaxID=34037 RepID=UPI000DC48787|nr:MULTISPECIES: hypothetical protein [Rahnella]AYA09662.1 hypothetical protein D3Z09_24225 [Rahnella aquatilis]MBU9842876.1 hypothetical protein [Rahnella aceris]QBJ07270.1 hypothetical protein EYS10_01615 [Rahnella aquatilis]QEU49779.1 hypothetical protein EJP80_24925 [Rahnella aquatilis]
MGRRRVTTGFRILIAVGIYVLVFLILRPSSPVTKEQYIFWNDTAALFGEPDVEGFIGLTLFIICPVITVLLYQVIVRLLHWHLNKPDK